VRRAPGVTARRRCADAGLISAGMTTPRGLVTASIRHRRPRRDDLRAHFTKGDLTFKTTAPIGGGMPSAPAPSNSRRSRHRRHLVGRRGKFNRASRLRAQFHRYEVRIFDTGMYEYDNSYVALDAGPRNASRARHRGTGSTSGSPSRSRRGLRHGSERRLGYPTTQMRNTHERHRSSRVQQNSEASCGLHRARRRTEPRSRPMPNGRACSGSASRTSSRHRVSEPREALRARRSSAT